MRDAAGSRHVAVGVAKLTKASGEQVVYVSVPWVPLRARVRLRRHVDGMLAEFRDIPVFVDRSNKRGRVTRKEK